MHVRFSSSVTIAYQTDLSSHDLDLISEQSFQFPLVFPLAQQCIQQYLVLPPSTTTTTEQSFGGKLPWCSMYGISTQYRMSALTVLQVSPVWCVSSTLLQVTAWAGIFSHCPVTTSYQCAGLYLLMISIKVMGASPHTSKPTLELVRQKGTDPEKALLQVVWKWLKSAGCTLASPSTYQRLQESSLKRSCF